MARICENCGKSKQMGMNVSHSNRKTKKAFHPNLQYTRVLKSGQLTRVRYCTDCIKALGKSTRKTTQVK